MTIVGAPVSSSQGVDTPPTSQRSQIVNSGRMPMAACSTACSVPGSSRGPMAAAASTSVPIVHQIARVTSRPGGSCRSSTASTSPLNTSLT